MLTIFLSTSSSRAHWAAQTSSVPVCVCMHTCVYACTRAIWVCLWVCVCVCARFLSSCKHLRAVFWDVQLSGSATGGKCWPVSFLAPQPPSSHHNMEILTDLILSFSLLSLLCSLHSIPALPLVTSLVGVQLSENARGDTKRISGFRASNQIYYNFWVDVNLTIKNKCCARD